MVGALANDVFKVGDIVAFPLNRTGFKSKDDNQSTMIIGIIEAPYEAGFRIKDKEHAYYRHSWELSEVKT